MATNAMKEAPSMTLARVETERQLWYHFRAEVLKSGLTLPEALTQLLRRVKNGEIKLDRGKR